MPALSRRALLAGLAALPVAGLAGSAARRAGDVAPLLRPGAQGLSSGRCAQCGDPTHTMLAAACPAAPAVGGRADG